jgi:hypothetical protein
MKHAINDIVKMTELYILLVRLSITHITSEIRHRQDASASDPIYLCAFDALTWLSLRPPPAVACIKLSGK